MKCELVDIDENGEDYKTLFTGTIDCDPEECQVVMHKGQAFAYDNSQGGEVAIYVLTAVAEFTEGKD